MPALWSAIRQTVKLVGSHRRLWTPFLAAALIEAALIGLVWLAPQRPFSALLAPPIRFFSREQFLHYPLHLWFMCYSMKYTHFVASVLAGAYLGGIGCVMIRQAHEGRALSFRDALASGQAHYGRLVLLWLLSWGASKLIIEGIALLPLGPAWIFWGAVLSTILLQALFVYVIPAAVFEGRSWWRAALQGIQETARHPFSTLALVAPITAIVVVLSIALSPTFVQRWMEQSAPEVAVLAVVIKWFSWSLLDAILTVAVCHLWWAHRQPATAPASSVTPAVRPAAFGKTTALLLLAGVLAAGSLSGCSNDYNGERLFWKASQIGGPLLTTTDLDKVDAQQATKAIAAYQHVIDSVPGSIWAARAQAAVGTIWAVQRQYDKARECYSLIFQNYNRYGELVLNARLAIAKTYEIEQRWDEAVKAYDEIMDYHPWSSVGMEAPIYVGRIYESRKNSEQASKAYERALRLYTKMIHDAPTPELAAQVKGYLALAYQRLARWDEAIRTLQEIVSQPTSPNRPLALLTLGAIYESKMSQPDQATSIYQQLIKEFPDHPLVRVAKLQLERIQKKSSDAATPSPTKATPEVPEPQAGSGAVPSPAAPTAPVAVH